MSVLRVRAAMKPISTVPRALETVDVAVRRGRHGHPPALRRLRGARLRASSPRRWSRSCSPRPASRSSAATRSPRPRATTPHTSPPSRRPCARGDARDWPARRARRAARVGQDHRGGGPGRRCSGSRCTTPTRPSRPPPGAPSPTSSSTTARRPSASLERAEVARAVAEEAGVVWPWAVARRSTPTTEQLLAGRPWCSSTSASPTRSKRVGFDQSRPLLAGQPPRVVGAR